MKSNYTFAGWEFSDRAYELSVNDYGGRRRHTLVLWKELENPHPPTWIYSYCGWTESGDRPQDQRHRRGIEYAAAWLIAHWYEHKLRICSCQHGEEPDDNASSLRFREAFIESLLFYENVLGWQG